MASKKSWEIYNSLIDRFGNELKIMMDVDKKELAKADPKLVDIIIANREGKLKIKPGYDGVYRTDRKPTPKQIMTVIKKDRSGSFNVQSSSDFIYHVKPVALTLQNIFIWMRSSCLLPARLS